MKQATAEVLTGESVEHAHGVDIPNATTVIYTADTRASVVAKFRELADRLESGALNGARCEWNDDPDMPAMVTVEVFPIVQVEPEIVNGKTVTQKRTIRLTRSTFAKPEERMRLIGEG
jgi:hypothetical protein